MNKLIIKSGLAVATGVLLLQIAVPAMAFRFGLEVNAQDDNAGSRPGLMRPFVRGNGRAAIGSGTIKAPPGATVPTSMVVTKREGGDVTVNISTSTQLRRRFWGKAPLSEFHVGDLVNVIGQWTSDAHTAIDARLIRDLSIQKRFGVFFGTVTTTGSGTLMISTKRGTETVTVDTTTKLVNRKEQLMVLGDIKVGDKVRVRGLWDSKLNTITEITKVKDYSLPVKT